MEVQVRRGERVVVLALDQNVQVDAGVGAREKGHVAVPHGDVVLRRRSERNAGHGRQLELLRQLLQAEL